MILYHRSPARNRLAISRWGLIPRSTADHHYPMMTAQPPGVFGIPHTNQLWNCSAWPREEVIDCWEIDASDLEYVEDPELPWCSGKIITERVPPDCLRRLPEFEGYR